MSERPTFLPPEAHIGRTSIRVLELAWEGLPLIVREYISGEIRIQEPNLSTQQKQDLDRLNMANLQVIIQDPEGLIKPMANFFEMKKKLIDLTKGGGRE